MPGDQATRKQRGAWYTPPDLVDVVVGGLVDDIAAFPPPSRQLTALDPACGDGRLLAALGERLATHDIELHATGCDIDRTALDQVADPHTELIAADALAHDWGARRFDVIVANPPFVSQMAAATTRGGSSRHGGGPYANTAAEFLLLAARLVEPVTGRVAMILPTSVLGARDAAAARATTDRIARRWWSWWTPEQRFFDAAVHICVVGFATAGPSDLPEPPDPPSTSRWTEVVTDRLGVPKLGKLAADGTLGDRAHLNANFRDEYYALVPAVDDDADGPPLVTSGVIDPARCRWGERPIRFAKRSFQHPRVDLARLEGRFTDWAARKLVPKVLVASQTPVVEAVADRSGEWLPGVPVTSIVPSRATDSTRLLDEIEAVLTSPVATILAWHAAAGTGLSTRAVRMSPGVLGGIAWPAGELTPAVEALRSSAVVECGRAVAAAYGLSQREIAEIMNWWSALLPATDAPSR